MPFPNLPTPPSLFPTYLVPSLPFRRRQSSTDSNTTTSSSSTAPSTPPSTSPPADAYLSGHTSHLRCNRCLSDLAPSTQIISKGFTGRHGRAYLVSASTSTSTTPGAAPSSSNSSAKNADKSLPNLPNTYTHKPVPRHLVTGLHTVGDISCAHCGSVLGWKYISASDESQHYKIGKFILETKRVCRSTTWENEDDVIDAHELLERRRRGSDGRRRSSLAIPPDELPDPDAVEFDSQDEDECEDLFMGVWTPQLAAKRREARVFGSSRIEED